MQEDSPPQPIADAATPRPHIGLGTLFGLFFKCGLAFGGGVGITAMLLDELVEKRRAMPRGEYVLLWGLGRIVPAGTIAALAVAVGHEYQGFLGTVVALVAMVLPSFTLTILLTIAYQAMAGSPLFGIVSQTLMPAALGVIVMAGYRLTREFAFPSLEILLAGFAMVAVLLFGLNPTVVLVLGGVAGAFGIRRRAPSSKS